MEDNLAVIQTRNWGTIGGNVCHCEAEGGSHQGEALLQEHADGGAATHALGT